MKRILNYIVVLTLCLSFARCSDYLNTSSPSNADDEFVTSTPAETFKILSWSYANYRQNCSAGVFYSWNDPIGSDAEMYPEQTSTNNDNAIMNVANMTIDFAADGFNGLYTTLARAAKVASIIEKKQVYIDAIAAGKTTEWTQLYGEAITMRSLCYFDLVKHFGDVPYGYEVLDNKYVYDYRLHSRFEIYDALIADLKRVEPYMFKIGQNGMTAERLTRTYANGLLGQIALYSGGYQTIRTDVPDLYGSVTFTKKGDEESGCVYARRTDYLDYYKIAETYLDAAMNAQAGTCALITTDERFSDPAAKNPFQRHFQYAHDLKISPESLFEVTVKQGSSANSQYGYAFGRPSGGGSSNSAPCKTFAAIRIVPTVYYGEFDNADKRRDVSVAVTGSAGNGIEQIISLVPGNTMSGGISINKWDENRMTPPYNQQRKSGLSIPVLRMADVILMLAEVKAELNEESEAINLANMTRQRAFGDNSHNISGTGEVLKEAILQERKLEFLGEGIRRWDLIRSGKFAEKAMQVKSDMENMIADLRTNGFHQFANGNQIPDFIYTDSVTLANRLTFQCVLPDTDSDYPAYFPGWRGQYKYTKYTKEGATKFNLAIQGLFKKITSSPGGTYKKVNWGSDIVKNESTYMKNILGIAGNGFGMKSATQPPKYYFPIPSETVLQSNGKVTNGYGLRNK